jgi:hypothetical protein
MSTITSVLNLSASYLVNDFYLPFVAKREEGDARHVRVARSAVVVVALVGVGVTILSETAGGLWQLVMGLTAGTGLVLLLRWLWWRVNAWSEISAMLASAGFSLLLGTKTGQARLTDLFGEAYAGAFTLPTVVALTTIVWLVATLLTRPVEHGHLTAFFEKVRPAGWWKGISGETGVARSAIGRDLLLWVTSSAFVFGGLFGIGSALLLDGTGAAILLTVSAVGGALTWVGLKADEQIPGSR